MSYSQHNVLGFSLNMDQGIKKSSPVVFTSALWLEMKDEQGNINILAHPSTKRDMCYWSELFPTNNISINSHGFPNLASDWLAA